MEEDTAASAPETMASSTAMIKKIEAGAVHRITSGQVIVDLQSVVKECVENSLDAGASSIGTCPHSFHASPMVVSTDICMFPRAEVRFKNNGLEGIEISDNGPGISPQDYETIALKHYTSKLASYSDLDSLRTFGFRGEALSSLCAVSNMHIVTATAEEEPRGTKLEFHSAGQLKGKAVVAAKRGTTVVVENLFGGLPVRRKELERKIKGEYGKCLQLLGGYACVSVSVRIGVWNLLGKG